MEDNISQIIKKGVQDNIEKEVDNMIEKEVKLFADKLLSNKDKFIAQLMEGIRIYNEVNPATMNMNYTIVFKNEVYLKERR